MENTTEKVIEKVIEEVVTADTVATAATVEVPKEEVSTERKEKLLKIQKQVEFYFSDANLPKDKFMLEQISKNQEGFVAMELLSSFGRMKTLIGDCEGDDAIQLIKEAVKDSKVCVVGCDEDSKMIRRIEALPEGRDAIALSLYMKGFPLDSTLESLEAFFAKITKNGVAAIRMRRVLSKEDKPFKGSLFVEFHSEEECKEVLESSKKEALKCGETELLVMTKMEYFEGKDKKSGSSGSASASEPSEKAESLLAKMGSNRLVKIGPMPATGGLSHEVIKQGLQETYPVSYVDFLEAPGFAWIRLKDPKAEEFATKYNAENPLILKSVEGAEKEESFTLDSVYLPTADEQAIYYENSMVKNNQYGKKRGNSGSGRGGRGGRDSKRSRGN